MNHRTTIHPKCPTCGGRLILYTDYVACETISCGGLVNPQWLGLPPVSTLRRQYPSLVSTLTTDKR